MPEMLNRGQSHTFLSLYLEVLLQVLKADFLWLCSGERKEGQNVFQRSGTFAWEMYSVNALLIQYIHILTL